MYPNPNNYSIKEVIKEEEMYYKRYEHYFRSKNISPTTMKVGHEKIINHEQVLTTEYGNVPVSSLTGTRDTNIMANIVIKHLPEMHYEEEGYYYSLSGDNFLGNRDMDSIALGLRFSTKSSSYD